MNTLRTSRHLPKIADGARLPSSQPSKTRQAFQVRNLQVKRFEVELTDQPAIRIRKSFYNRDDPSAINWRELHQRTYLFTYPQNLERYYSLQL
jgi:hypothetical protein